MVGRKGGLLAGVAGLAVGACNMGPLGVPMTASERRLGRYLRAPEGHGEGGGGGAGGLLEDDAGEGDKGAGGEGDKGGGEGDKGAGGEGDKGGGADLAWASGVSAEKAEGEDLSNIEWLQKRGYKDINGVVKSARDLERSVRESGKVKIPGADAKPEEVKAFREAIGVPDKPEEYAVDLPEAEGGEFKLELDTAFLDPLRKVAHENNVPAAAFKAMADQFVTQQLEDMKAEAVRADAARDAKVKEWGAKAAQMKGDFRRGAEILGLKKQDIAELEAGGKTGLVMDLLAKVGGLAGEDFFAGEGGSQKFGVSSEEEAQGALDQMTADKDTYAKLKAKDPATVQKYNRLVEGVAHFRQLKAVKR